MESPCSGNGAAHFSLRQSAGHDAAADDFPRTMRISASARMATACPHLPLRNPGPEGTMRSDPTGVSDAQMHPMPPIPLAVTSDRLRLRSRPPAKGGPGEGDLDDRPQTGEGYLRAAAGRRSPVRFYAGDIRSDSRALRFPQAGHRRRGRLPTVEKAPETKQKRDTPE